MLIESIKKDPFIQKIIKNSGIILFGDITAALLNLISFALVANSLGPESLAIIVLIQTYILIINNIFNIQTWESMIKFGHGCEEKVLSTVKTNTILDSVSSIIAYIFSLLLITPVITIIGWENNYTPLITIYSVTILFNLTSLTIGLPRLLNHFASVAKIQIVMAILRLVSISLVVLSSNNLTDFIYVFIGIDILTNLALIFYSQHLLHRYFDAKWWKAKIFINKDQLKFIWWSNLRTIIRTPVQRLDMLIISAALSLEVVGIYKVYKEVAGIINRLRAPVNVALFPEFTKVINNNDINIYRTIRRTIILMSGASFIITLLLLISSGTIIDTFFGTEYLKQLDVLYYLIVLFGLGFAISPIDSAFIAAGFAKYNFYIVLTTNILYLIVALVSVAAIGLYGIIMAYGCHLFLNKGAKFIIMYVNPKDWSSTIR